MTSDELNREQIEKLKARIRPGLRRIRKLAEQFDHELDPKDTLRLRTWQAADALQHLLGGLHYLGVSPGSAGKLRK